MKCSHKISYERAWFPETETAFRPVPVCDSCGTLKNVSADRGKNIGFYINILTQMKRHLERNGYKISDSQIRLIINEISRADGFDDAYWIKKSTQRSIFIKSVQKFVPLTRAFVERFF